MQTVVIIYILFLRNNIGNLKNQDDNFQSIKSYIENVTVCLRSAVMSNMNSFKFISNYQFKK